MLHLFNRIYAAIDFEFNGKYPYTMISDRIFPVSPLTKIRTIKEDISLENFLEEEYNGDINLFFKYLYQNSEKKEKEDTPLAKYVIYLEPTDYARLQIQYYKSIFKRHTEESLYNLYRLKMEGHSLRLIAKRGMNPLPISHLSDTQLIRREEFNELYKNSNPISFITKSIPKEKLGIEYLLADYFASPTSKYKTILSKRIDQIVWEGIVDILQETMWEMSGHIFSTARLFGEPLDYSASILDQLAKTKQFWWIADKEFSTDNKEYCKKLFSESNFADILERYLKCGMDASDIEIERIIDRIKNYGEESPLETLEKDVHTTNTLYNLMSAPAFEGKTNFLFIDYLYEKVRAKETKDLSIYKLL